MWEAKGSKLIACGSAKLEGCGLPSGAAPAEQGFAVLRICSIQAARPESGRGGNLWQEGRSEELKTLF